jgi:hypothetical protein
MEPSGKGGFSVFLNLSNDILGIGPGDGVTYQVTSYGRRGSALGGLAGRAADKCVDLKPGVPFTAAQIDGPGMITRIWVTLPGPLNPGALRDVVVKMYWDGEEEPSVLAPLGDLFGATFARPVEYGSAYISITSGAFLCHFPMPFRGSARIVFENQGRGTVRLFFYQFTYLKLNDQPQESTPYFHCHWRRESLARGAAPFTVLDARGRGMYLGCHLDMQGTGIPWGPNPFHWFLPEGYGMGMLEGWERMWIDGSAEPNVSGTGGEDYFNGAWYFTSVPSTWLTHGVTRRSYPARQVSCYRFHVEMPVAFNEGILVTLDHGLDNKVSARYDGTAFWYQDEPHAPLEELPPAGERRGDGAMKGLLTMAVPLVYAGAALGIARSARRALCERKGGAG